MRSFYKIRTLLSAVAVAGLVPAAAAAQETDDNTAFGTTSAEFLLLGAGARGAALGGSFAALADDPSALYHNPAGIALARGPGVSLSTYDYIVDTRYSWGGVVFPFAGGARAFGVQLGTFGFSDQPVYTVEQPDGTGSVYSVNETFVGLTYAQNFSDRFSAGLTAKMVIDQLGEANGSAFAVDFGTNFHAMLNNHPIKFSFVLANLGTNLSYTGDALNVDIPREPLPGEGETPTVPIEGQLRTKDFSLPTIFRVGLAYDLFTGEDSRLTLLGDFNQPTSAKAGFVFGGEWAAQRLGGSGFGAALRGSYTYQASNKAEDVIAGINTDLADDENLQGLGLGGGINYAAANGFLLGVDYAYRHMGVFGGTSFFTFNVGW
ncbi:MAG TPA: PorV/PorQ family protein [Gemmatimonadales bacterium]|nr:PorV/PorQ family protein [Gemmatimonadales bacterium]